MAEPIESLRFLPITLGIQEVFRGSKSAKRAQNQPLFSCESLRLNGEPLKIWLSNSYFTLLEIVRNDFNNSYVSLIAKPEPRTRRSLYALLSAENAPNLEHIFGMDAKYISVNYYDKNII